MKRLLLGLLLSLSVACQSAVPGPVLPRAEAVAANTYKIVASIDGEPQWSGTAWKVDADHVVTAGHVCDAHDRPGHLSFSLLDADGHEEPAILLDYVLSDEVESEDACILLTNAPGPGLNLAPEPAYDEPVMYVGAPDGMWGSARPTYRGHYVGGNVVVMAGAPGVSGSAVLSDKGVIGIFVAGQRGNIGYLAPSSLIRKLLERNI